MEVVLQNIHLTKKWLPSLEKKMDHYAENSHENYRIFVSAEPAASAAAHIIPQGILESSIKITNEPPVRFMYHLDFPSFVLFLFIVLLFLVRNASQFTQSSRQFHTRNIGNVQQRSGIQSDSVFIVLFSCGRCGTS